MTHNRRWQLRVTVALAAAGLALTACEEQADGPQPSPELAGADLNGDVQDIRDMAGDVVVVNAWASWCGPCREEMPVLEAAHQTLGEHGLHVIGMNIRDLDESARQLVEETGVTFPSVVDEEGTLAVDWGIVGMPQTFVVDSDGFIVDRRFGAVDEQWVEEIVEPLVFDGASDPELAEGSQS